jgi:hypothetical protein
VAAVLNKFTNNLNEKGNFYLSIYRKGAIMSSQVFWVQLPVLGEGKRSAGEDGKGVTV